MMRYLEKIFYFFFPLERVKNTPWHQIWLEKQRNEFLTSSKIFFPVCAAVYVLHYFTVDKWQGLAPSDLWFNYRFGMTTLLALTFGYYLSSFSKNQKLYKVPAILACGVACFLQSKTVVWYSEVPYVYGFFFVFISTYIFRLGIIGTIFISSLLVAIQFPNLIEANISIGMALSGGIVTVIFSLFIRSKIFTEIDFFLASQNLHSAQKKMIEMNIEFNNEIQSFLPRKICEKIHDYTSNKRMTVIQAIDEVLRPTLKNIACLHSDIRGFSRNSKNINDFLLEKAIPDIKESVNIVEQNHGVPRIIGDLVLSYFDDDSIELNLMNAILTAISMHHSNENLNLKHSSQKVIRQFIISAGEAIVGNIGGIDSREVTALGPPVNLIARIDELSKIKSLKDLLNSDMIILTENAHKILKAMLPEISSKEVILKEIGLEIRDFKEDEDRIFLISLNTTNMQQFYNYYKDNVLAKIKDDNKNWRISA